MSFRFQSAMLTGREGRDEQGRTDPVAILHDAGSFRTGGNATSRPYPDFFHCTKISLTTSFNGLGPGCNVIYRLTLVLYSSKLSRRRPMCSPIVHASIMNFYTIEYAPYSMLGPQRPMFKRGKHKCPRHNPAQCLKRDSCTNV